MNSFSTYLQLGLGHILNIAAIDHLLFILSFIVGLQFQDYKKAISYVTAFTLGHSITLALATLHLIDINVAWIEFLIPITIVLSTIGHWLKGNHNSRLTFGTIALFGLIHGLGFSNYLQSLLGQEQSILLPLLAFNVGVELAQLIVVGFLLLLMEILLNYLRVNRNYLMIGISLLILAFTLPMIFERIP
ncbi:MAG: hypothetical protein RI995_798 [Bacteroidota bacterium]|jgi:hypothetical protein